MSMRMLAFEALGTQLATFMRLANPPSIVQAPPSEVTEYPAMAVVVDATTMHYTQNWDLETDADGNLLVGSRAQLTPGPAVASYGADGSRLAKIGSFRGRGRIWLASRLPEQRAELEDEVILAFAQEASAPGRLDVCLRGASLYGITLPWDWIATAMIDTDATWTQEQVFSERLWSYVSFKIDLDMLVPRKDPLVQQFVLAFDADVSQPVDDNGNVLDLDAGADDQTYSLDSSGNIIPYP